MDPISNHYPIEEIMSEEADSYEPDMTPGLISWNELMSPDVGGSIEFYKSLLGWTHESVPMPYGEYHMFKLGDRPVAGMVQITEEMGDCPPMWCAYVTVEDADAAVAKASELGAQVVKEVTDLPMGRFAVIVDPQGAAISFWESKEGVEC